MKNVNIHIGELYASRDAAVVETVLGSCVAVCLHDPVNHLGGMNHILLPRRCQDDPLLARYGEHAIPMLIEHILKLGGRKRNLQAKVFGAASVLTIDEARLSVPRANETFVREFLVSQGIPLLAERMGGRQPFRVRMFTDTGRVLVRVLPRTQLDRLLAREGEQYLSATERRWSWFEDAAALEGTR